MNLVKTEVVGFIRMHQKDAVSDNLSIIMVSSH